MQVLQGLPRWPDAKAIVGLETADDAAVYQLDDRTAIVETVDFFSPIVDDPYTFGQIAAANALSDIYAMGARPLFALNIAGFPRAKLPLSVLQEILRGGADKAHEAGISILGGHTVDDPEPKYGLVVTGLVDPARVARNRGAQAGDRLVLTKPLGTGIVSNALKQDRCPAQTLELAVASMKRLNRDGAEALAEVPVHACTDVTGFGLVGHLRGMLEASGVGARLFCDRLPVFPGVRELAAGGFVPGGTRRNQAFYAPSVAVNGADAIDSLVAHDAQTSGGLLLSVAAASLDALQASLLRRGALAAAVVGEVVAANPGSISLER